MPHTVRKTVHINAPIEKVWAALTNAKAIGAWMGDGSVKSTPRKGGKYSYFGNATTGQYTEYEKPALLEYTWRQHEWPKDWADSVVRWELKADKTGTKIKLAHTQFSNKEERDGHDEGWDVYWLEPMKKWLEAN
jgi:uncharacterized protein YndB with AHSA1/START domain